MKTGNFPRGTIFLCAAMIGVIAVSNILVQYPFTPWGLGNLLTWAAFSYPLAFLVTDLANRFYGANPARTIVWLAFPPAILLSGLLGDQWRIAFASGAAFLIAQNLDIHIFDRLRRAQWWQAPIISSGLGSIADTALFFSLAFAGAVGSASYGLIELPLWVGWATGDLAVKLLLAPVLLVPYRFALAFALPKPAPRTG